MVIPRPLLLPLQIAWGRVSLFERSTDYYLTVLEEAVVYAKMQGQWWRSMVQNARPDVQPRAVHRAVDGRPSAFAAARPPDRARSADIQAL